MLPCYSIGELKNVLHVSFLFSFNPHGLFATLDMYSVWTEKEYSQMCTNILFRGTFRNFLGEDPSSTTTLLTSLLYQ